MGLDKFFTWIEEKEQWDHYYNIVKGDTET